MAAKVRRKEDWQPAQAHELGYRARRRAMMGGVEWD
jgi:hypothetical protein